jgi:hypothetical protein
MAGFTDEIKAALHAQLTSAPKQSTNEAVKHYRYNGGRAHYSDALGVAPEQIGDAREELRRHGVMAEFAPDGRCIVESEKQFQDVSRALGMQTGRDGYRVKDNSGTPMLTGRQAVEERRETKRMLERMIRRGEDF